MTYSSAYALPPSAEGDLPIPLLRGARGVSFLKSDESSFQ